MRDEISFKAGYEQREKDPFDKEDRCDKCYKQGIKEVVEFINNLIIGIEGCKFEERFDGDKGCILLDMNENQWQTKLKEWDIDKS